MRLQNALPLSLAMFFGLPAMGAAQDDVIPHAQSKAPGKALTPAEAIEKMVVPEGFKVELVASEPDLVNPVSMTFDERGRIWVTESLEYPRNDPGPGRDRIKVLEDTDGDGKADRFSIFAEGLNIPSGIAVGHGGVWVANSPDILFLKDTDGDGKADVKEVVVTGFGRDDTHELPNSLTWGPDGWLYGWNGVFNRSVVHHRGKTFDFTCAIFRIHPKTREFELFCEGTSNPWGIAFDSEGSTFASACVIDHLWHLTETGYYHRQGGAYPPHIWKIESIADHRHQQAAYCGIHYFDSDAYPPEFRDRLYLGNVHAGSLNVDTLKRNGSTYVASAGPDFLQANDAWFMPVSQKTGPDGSLYVLDWYDRYHCYQDAQRDSAGIDRLKGRLYRIRYKETPRAPKFDMAAETDLALIQRLSSPNIYYRDTAQRLLVERADPASRLKLQEVVFAAKAERKTRLHALWALVGVGPLDPVFHERLLKHDDAAFRAWAVRAAGNQHRVSADLISKISRLADDPSADVRLQVAIASRKIEGVDALSVLSNVLANSNDDLLIQKIVWRNLEPLFENQATAERWAASLDSKKLTKSPAQIDLIPRIVVRLLSNKNPLAVDLGTIATKLLKVETEQADKAANEVFWTLSEQIQNGQIKGNELHKLKSQIESVYTPILKSERPESLLVSAGLLAAGFESREGISFARDLMNDPETDKDLKIDALNALIFAKDETVLSAIDGFLAKPTGKEEEFQGHLLASLSRVDRDEAAGLVLKHYRTMDPELQPKAIEILTQRPAWTLALLKAIASKDVDRNVLNVNQLRNLQESKNASLVKALTAEYGTIRTGRNPQRESVIAETRDFLSRNPGDPHQGMAVFKRVCGQCHKLYGEGEDVGPEITRNGRASYEQLLSNVFDPSLVIGTAFQGTTVATNDGRVLSGLVVEDSPQRIVLKMQGGKLETIAQSDVDLVKKSDLSLMPEDLEKQLKPQELADLFAFISLDRPPTDPKAAPIPGAEDLHKAK